MLFDCSRESYVERRKRRSLLDDTDSTNKLSGLSSAAVTEAGGDKALTNGDTSVTSAMTGRSAVERTLSTDTTMSASAMPGETREERIARLVRITRLA